MKMANYQISLTLTQQIPTCTRKHQSQPLAEKIKAVFSKQFLVSLKLMRSLKIRI